MERGHSRAPQVRTLTALGDGLHLSDDDRAALTAAATAARVPSTAGRPRLCELPRGVTDFVGRADELAVARTAVRTTHGGPPPVLVVHGQAGLGKTAFAVRVADELRDDFPDGRLYLDLRGVDANPLPVGDALHRLLRALDISSDRIADSDDERSAQLRAVLRDRRCLIVLDNAGSEAQVRPLLPADGPGLVIVTSRRLLGGLEGATRLGLPPLSPAESAGLLGAIAVQAADPASAEHVATVSRLCGYLPLALRIASTRLASRPQWTVAHLVDRLTDADRRLAALASGDTGVAAAFALSYAQLSAAAATLFRRLAHVPGTDFAAPIAAVLTETALPEAEERLDELVEYGMLQPEGVDRYRFHDLIGLYAGQRLRAEEPPGTRAVTARRMTDWLLETAVVAGRWHDPRYGSLPKGWSGLVPLATCEEAGAWLRAESGNWLAALRTAAADDRHQLVVDVVEATFWYSDLTARWHGWYEVRGLSRAAALALPDRHQQARQLNHYAWTAIYSGRRPDEAAEAATQAYHLAREIGAVTEQIRALRFTADAWLNLDRTDDALSAYRDACALADQAGEHDEHVSIIVAIAFALERIGRFGEAVDEHRRALAELDHRPVSSRVSLGLRMCALDGVAVAGGLLGLWEESLRAAEQALPLLREFGEDPYILGRLLASRGLARVALGQAGEARADLIRGIELLDQREVPSALSRRLNADASRALADLGDEVP